jgi:hypothetical protein
VSRNACRQRCVWKPATSHASNPRESNARSRSGSTDQPSRPTQGCA